MQLVPINGFPEPSASGLLEDVVVSGSTPPHPQLALDGDEFEGCATVWAGEGPRHLQHAAGGADWFDSQGRWPGCGRIGGVSITGGNELLPYDFSELAQVLWLQSSKIRNEGRGRLELHSGASRSSRCARKSSPLS